MVYRAHEVEFEIHAQEHGVALVRALVRREVAPGDARTRRVACIRHRAGRHPRGVVRRHIRVPKWETQSGCSIFQNGCQQPAISQEAELYSRSSKVAARTTPNYAAPAMVGGMHSPSTARTCARCAYPYPLLQGPYPLAARQTPRECENS